MLKNILILILTFITAFVSIGGNTWVEEEGITLQGWISIGSFALLLVLGIWKEIESWVTSEKRRPKPRIEFSQSEEGEVIVEIECDSPDAAQIEDLMFKFDIPGVFIREEVDVEKIGNCDISHSLLCGNRDGPLAETIHVACRTLFPQSFIRIRIHYESKASRVAFLDLHDYSRLIFSWVNEGTSKIEKSYLSLKNLPYIIQDNKDLVKGMNQLYPDLESVEKMEWERKDW